jgi:pimeloyl-ACP methyl ester carboxylesterase
MPALAKRFTVVAIDLPGIGRSTGTPDGYGGRYCQRPACPAQGLGLKRPYIVGHDIGSMVAYAYARLFPREARGIMILDAPLPGIQGWDQIQGDPSVWHIRFMQVPGLAEKLIASRSPISSTISSISLRAKSSITSRPTHLPRSFTLRLKYIAPFLTTPGSMPRKPRTSPCPSSLTPERIRLLPKWHPSLRRASAPMGGFMWGRARLHPYVRQKKWGHIAVRCSIVAANRVLVHNHLTWRSGGGLCGSATCQGIARGKLIVSMITVERFTRSTFQASNDRFPMP